MPAVSVGPYRVLEHLGAGANGAVFLAEDTRLHRRVALKTVSAPRGTAGDARRSRVLREARAAARLNHPRIAAVYDVIEAEDEIHIVMEHVRGTTLAARVRTGPLPSMQVLDLGLQLSHALAHAHGMGVIHRDLKPANIMITPQGEAKILDFGLARLYDAEADSVALSASASLTFDGRVVGTPPYIPPEVLRGEPAGARGDIYSLGVTLFELLTGKRPFEAANGIPLTTAILSAPTPRPRSSGADVPVALDEVVYRAIARDPADRQSSALELAAEFDRVAASITDPSTQSGRLALPAPPQPAPSRRRTIVAGLAVVAAIAAVTVALRREQAVLPRPAAPGTQVIAVRRLHAATEDPVEQSVASGVAESLTTALAKVPGITVASRDAMAADAPDAETVDALARRLGATRVVDGTVQRSGEKLRVNLTVSRPGSASVGWAGGFEGSVGDLFSLQNRAVADVLDGLGDAVPEGFVATLVPPTENTEALAEYLQGRAFLERSDVKGNIDRSIALFESAIRRDARFARARAGLGEASWRKYLETNDRTWSATALQSTMDAVLLDPGDASVRYTLALLQEGTGRVAEAIAEVRRVLALQPRNDEAQALLGRLLASSGKVEEGIAAIRTAISLRPQYWRHHLSLGGAFYDAGRYAEAAQAYLRVTQLQPDSGWGFQMLGTCYHALGDRTRAKEQYLRAIELGDARAHSNLGTLYYEEQRFPEAARAFEQALSLEPGSPLKHRNLGDIYTRMGDKARAQKAYRSAAEITRDQLRTNPRDALNIARLAVYEAKLGRHDEAARLSANAEAASPGNPEVTYRQAVVLTLAGRLDEAILTLDKAIRQGYSAKFIEGDDDFAPLRKRAEFQKLLKTAD